LTFKGHCNHLAGLCSSAKIITIKEKLHQSTISYTNPPLVTLFIKIISIENLKTVVAIAFKKINYTSSTISYTSSTISYTNPPLVTLRPPLVTLLSTISYTSSTISYTRTAKSTVISTKTELLLKLLKFFIKIVKQKQREYS
jgi:hypothetical protein